MVNRGKEGQLGGPWGTGWGKVARQGKKWVIMGWSFKLGGDSDQSGAAIEGSGRGRGRQVRGGKG